MQFQGFDWLSGHGTTMKQPLNCLLGVFLRRNQQDLAIFFIDFNKIIPLALVGYEMIIAHLISNALVE